jgi:hypothetical protein
MSVRTTAAARDSCVCGHFLILISVLELCYRTVTACINVE